MKTNIKQNIFLLFWIINILFISYVFGIDFKYQDSWENVLFVREQYNSNDFMNYEIIWNIWDKNVSLLKIINKSVTEYVLNKKLLNNYESISFCINKEDKKNNICLNSNKIDYKKNIDKNKYLYNFENTLNEYFSWKFEWKLISWNISFVDWYNWKALQFHQKTLIDFPYLFDINSKGTVSFYFKLWDKIQTNLLIWNENNCSLLKNNFVFIINTVLNDWTNEKMEIIVDNKYYSDDNFHLFSLVFNNTNKTDKIKIYIDGKRVKSKINTYWNKNDIWNSNSVLSIWSFWYWCENILLNDNLNYLIIDEFKIYNYDIDLFSSTNNIKKELFQKKVDKIIEKVAKTSITSNNIEEIVDWYLLIKKEIYDQLWIIYEELLISKEKSYLINNLDNEKKEDFIAYLNKEKIGEILITNFWSTNSSKMHWVADEYWLNPFASKITEYKSYSQITQDKLYSDIALIYTSQYLMWLLFLILIFLLIYNYLSSYLWEIFFRNSFFIKKKILNMMPSSIVEPNNFTFDLNFKNLYNQVNSWWFKMSMSLLYGIIMWIKTRWLTILLWRNGIWKTSLIENIVKSIYDTNYINYYKKILIKQEIDDERKILWYYDRLNNTYVDPYNLMKFILKAYNDRSKPYFLLFDEINMSDIERFFPLFLQMDEILEKWESDFIKIVSIDFSEKKDISTRKYKLVNQFKFILNESNKIIDIWYKIPSNLIILWTANIDITTKPFTWKIVDRADFIWLEDYTSKNLEIFSINKVNVLSRNVVYNQTIISNEIITFLSGIVQIMNLSKRVQKSLVSYIWYSIQLWFYDFSYWINQKILPLIYDNRNKDMLLELLEYLNNYKNIYNLKKSIIKIEHMLKNDFISFWIW